MRPTKPLWNAKIRLIGQYPPDGLKGFPLEGKHSKVDPLGSEGDSQGKKKAKDMGKGALG